MGIWENLNLQRAEAFFRDRPKLTIAVLGGAAGVLLICIIVLLLNLGHAPAADTLSAEFAPLPVPPEELFLSDEPDFVPGVLLEREPRAYWTAEDALPYWTDPLDKGSGYYLTEIESIIDGIMETVP
ncbi:hypothetical protein FACS1894151_05630 [Spirochaetia bacterium]|nr:hypothetical protein FACS1894151_05630 [Spirochaetia bacterium]